MVRKFRPTFSEIAADARLRPQGSEVRGAHGVRPGRFNLAGEFFDPSGSRLDLSETEISPAEALAVVKAGALLAFEACGCGGDGLGGCEIEWFESKDIADSIGTGEPVFVNLHGSPTWIDLWSGQDRRVVFAHGDVRWGSVLL